MKLSTWRPAIIAWLNQRVNIQTWELRNPLDVGETAGFLPPLKYIKHSVTEAGKEAEATQEIYITTRYSRDLKYAQLPLGLIEGVYSSICQDLLDDGQGIVDGLDILINPGAHHMVLTDPIQIQESGDDIADWLITMVFYVTIKWIPEVESDMDFGFPGYNINQINFGIYRAKLPDFNDRVLDSTWSSSGVNDDRPALTVDDSIGTEVFLTD